VLAVFESILPIFLLLVAGNALRRFPLLTAEGWSSLERLGYWVLYPALLFISIAEADLTGLSLDVLGAVLIGTVLLMAAVTVLCRRPLELAGMTQASQFSSIFQTSIRWNGFIALAVAQSVFPPAGVAVVALTMAAIIVPINVMSVYMVATNADRSMSWSRLLRAMATNPMIIAVLLAVLMKVGGLSLYAPVQRTLELVGDAALGMGLLSIGAGLRVADLHRPGAAMVVPTVIKLILFPVAGVALSIMAGLAPDLVAYVALCCAVPTAMNGYLLARQLGGDAELYAAVATLQTALSFLTIPLMLAAVGYIAG
jgi:malonate transporter